MSANAAAAEAASAVRALPDLIERAWADFRTEFNVQVSVWDSLAMTGALVRTPGAVPPGEEHPEASLRAELDAALSAADVQLLEAALTAWPDIAGKSTEAAARGVRRAGRTAAARRDVAVLLEALCSSDGVAPAGGSEKELEALLKQCELKDVPGRLEQRVRQLLGAPPAAPTRRTSAGSSGGARRRQ